MKPRLACVCVLALLALAPSASAGPLGTQTRISQNGAPRSAGDPSIAYDTQQKRYLAVWAANTGGSTARIYGRFLRGDGQPLGDHFTISNNGPPVGSDSTSDPFVAYNADSHQFLVVWHGSDGASAPCGTGIHIRGQRLSKSGARIGPHDFAISPPEQRCTRDPKVIYNPHPREYLVVWDTQGETAAEVGRVFGQRLDATGAAVGPRSFAISEPSHLGTDTTVTLDPFKHQYLVAWEDAHAIIGQRLGESGAKRSSNFEIGGAPDAVSASATFNTALREFLVVWQSPDPTTDSLPSAIVGQRLAESGQPVGTTAFPISDPALFAKAPAVAYNPSNHRFVVVFHGTRNGKALTTRTFGQELGTRGARIGPSFVLSHKGDDAEEARTLAWNPDGGEFLTAWATLIKQTYTVFSRRISG